MEATLVPRLKRLRKAAALSQEALAEKIGLHGPAVSKIEALDRRLTVGEFVAWCQACGVSPAAVLNGEALTVTVPITESVSSGMSE